MSEEKDNELTDSEIIAAFKAGNNQIYTKIIEKYYTKAYQIAYSILRQKEDAEEVVQDSFVKIHKVLHDFRGDSQFSTWMYRIITNYAKNRYRWNKRRGSKQNVSINAPLNNSEDNNYVLDLPGKELNPQSGSVYNELEKGVHEHLQTISPLYREVLILRNLDGLSYEEIASILDCKIGTVKSRIARGRDELRQRLKNEDLI
jgi:RNA polymerase sigma-70 factor, ECF subfamily